MLVQVIEGVADRFRRALEAADDERVPAPGPGTAVGIWSNETVVGLATP